MPEPNPNPPISQAFRFLRRQVWLILGVPAVAVAAAAIVVSSQQHVYRASMGIVVAQTTPNQPSLGNLALSQTMTGIIGSDVVAKQVVNKLHLRISSSKLLQNLIVSVKPDSSLIEVSYDSPHKREAV